MKRIWMKHFIENSSTLNVKNPFNHSDNVLGIAENQQITAGKCMVLTHFNQTHVVKGWSRSWRKIPALSFSLCVTDAAGCDADMR